MAEQVTTLPVNQIKPNPKNFFRDLPPEELDALVNSIKEVGVLHPLVVREISSGTYEILSGHQRHMAVRQLGWTEVPCILVETDDKTAELMLIDANLETRKLTTMEMARAIRKKKELLDIRQGKRMDLTSAVTSEVAASLSLSERHMRRLDKLNDLIPALQDLVDAGKLGVMTGERLARLPHDTQEQLYETLGDAIADLTGEEVKRLRHENEQGFKVIAMLNEEMQRIKEEREALAENVGTRDDLKREIDFLKRKKTEVNYDLADYENALREIKARKTSVEVALFNKLQLVYREVQANKPEIEVLVEQYGVSEALAPYVRKWGLVFMELGKTLVDATEGKIPPQVAI